MPIQCLYVRLFTVYDTQSSQENVILKDLAFEYCRCVFYIILMINNSIVMDCRISFVVVEQWKFYVFKTTFSWSLLSRKVIVKRKKMWKSLKSRKILFSMSCQSTLQIFIENFLVNGTWNFFVTKNIPSSSFFNFFLLPRMRQMI